MKYAKHETKKNMNKKYTAPELTITELDMEISLAMESDPAPGPGETLLINPQQMPNDPYRNNG